MEEQWVDYHGYKVCNDGRIIGKRNRPLTQQKNYHKGRLKRPNAYYWVVRILGRCRKIHSIVADCFLPPKPEGNFCIDHIDGNKDNNRADNLRWCLWKENSSKQNRPLN